METQQKEIQVCKIMVPVSINQECLEEVLITALEGGSNYWYWIDDAELNKAKEWLDGQIKDGKLQRNENIHYMWMDALFQGYETPIFIFDKEQVYDDSDARENEDFSGLTPTGNLSMKQIQENLPLAQEKHKWAFDMHFPEYNNGDGASADVIFQMIVLGEVIYG